MEALEISLPTLLVASIVLLLSCYLAIKLSRSTTIHGNRKKLNLPPGPSKLPIIGNLHQLGSSPHISLRRLSKRFGPIFYLQLGHIPTIIISSASLAKDAMTTHDLAFASRPQLYSAKCLFYNCTDMAFAPYGAYWRHIRKICVLELLSVKRVQSYSFIRTEEVTRMVHRVAASNTKSINLTKILGLYSNDVLCRAAFGRDFSGGGEYDKHDFRNMLEDYQILLGGSSLGEYFPSMEWINMLTGKNSRLLGLFRRFDNFFNDIIEEHRNAKRIKEEHKDILDVLLDMQKHASHDMPLTMDNIKALILDIFAAGTETTFITLEWGMTELVMNPKAMKKAQSEIRSVVGERTRILESDLPQMHYLKAVIKEILRLHPPAPVLVPRESKEGVVINGYDVPAKTLVVINAWAIGRDPQSWSNPEVFEPDRFMGSSIDFRGRDFVLIPFGAGRRSCPGITFGIATVELALAQLLHSFDWELPPGVDAKDLDMTENFGLTMQRVQQLLITAKPYFPTII